MQAKAGLSLLFAVGTRPSADDMERMLTASAEFSRTARISYRPPDDHGWIELLASGLTFDMHGLAPGSAMPVPSVDHVYGLPTDVAKFEFEAITLAPGEHIAAGGPLMPVVRSLLSLAASLTLDLPIAAICWNPAGSWMDPKYFGRVIVSWLAGGGFPALGLTGLKQRADGVFESTGLAYFTGQEVCVPPRGEETGSETVRLAGRLIDYLVRSGPLEKRTEFSGPGGEELVAEPSPDGRYVMVARSR